MIKKQTISRKMRKVFVKTPGGKTQLVYKRPKTSKHKCAACGAILKGVPNRRPSKVRKLPKSLRRPERPYGGQLCSSCTRKKLRQKVRKVSKK